MVSSFRIVSIAMVAYAGAVAAQQSGDPLQTGATSEMSPTAATAAQFQKLDRDQSGAVSRQEAAEDQLLSREFSELDRDRDGELDQGEFARFEVSQFDRPADSGPSAGEAVNGGSAP